MNNLLLTREILNVAEIIGMVSASTCGAISLFVGTTRDSFEGRKVLFLEYEAYEPMALKHMEAICEELRRQWPDIKNIAIYHRLGLVPVGQSSVVIAVSSPHRKTSLDAVGFAIEELKKRVPIWKKEKYEHNESSWKENKESNEDVNMKLFQFDEQTCYMDETYEIRNPLVQISVDEYEINRRINCFVKRKRIEIDLCNIMDYTESQSIEYCGEGNYENNVLGTCARVNSSIIKQEFSKCHLKVKRVKNNVGPQLRPDYLNALDKLMTSTEKNTIQLNLQLTEMANDKECNPQTQSSKILNHQTVIERMKNIEQHLNISPSSTNDMYKRLRNVEDRILYLECISPEYHNFFVTPMQENCNTSHPHCSQEVIKSGTEETSFSSLERKTYSADDIDAIIHDFEG